MPKPVEMVRVISAHNRSGPGRFRFSIGLNEIPRPEFEAMIEELKRPSVVRPCPACGHPQRQEPLELMALERLFDEGELRFAPDEKPASKNPASAPVAPAVAVAESGLPADEAAALAVVRESKDSAQLEAWFKIEARPNVFDALGARLKELDASSGSGGAGADAGKGAGKAP